MSLSKILVRGFFITGGVLAIVFTILLIGVNSRITSTFQESVPYKLSIDYIKNDEVIKNKLGSNIQFSDNIGGHLTPNKDARLVFKVSGEKSSVRAVCIAKYNGSEWQIESITYE
ncbi:cytochrome c oxidase assembly factor Coa1 family protein [Roseivirga seohaensis]|uniref:cytochrome c oxidase assembly factor Coa1 family protein n=1 Tax=Roseivirga seohaensis TaxID=1914963 RepID=UPI003BA9701D